MWAGGREGARAGCADGLWQSVGCGAARPGACRHCRGVDPARSRSRVQQERLRCCGPWQLRAANALRALCRRCAPLLLAWRAAAGAARDWVGVWQLQFQSQIRPGAWVSRTFPVGDWRQGRVALYRTVVHLRPLLFSPPALPAVLHSAALLCPWEQVPVGLAHDALSPAFKSHPCTLNLTAWT